MLAKILQAQVWAIIRLNTPYGQGHCIRLQPACSLDPGGALWPHDLPLSAVLMSAWQIHMHVVLLQDQAERPITKREATRAHPAATGIHATSTISQPLRRQRAAREKRSPGRFPDIPCQIDKYGNKGSISIIKRQVTSIKYHVMDS